MYFLSYLSQSFFLVNDLNNNGQLHISQCGASFNTLDNLCDFITEVRVFSSMLLYTGRYSLLALLSSKTPTHGSKYK
jgi:hypothetical protein